MRTGPVDDDQQMIAALYFALAVLSLAVAASFALNVGKVAELPLEWHLDWRRKAGQRSGFGWLRPPEISESEMRRMTLWNRVGFTAVLLVFAAVLFAAGPVGVG